MQPKFHLTVNAYAFTSFRQYFRMLWQAYREAAGGKTSIAKFSRAVGIKGHGTCAQLLRGGRDLTPHYARIVGEALGLRKAKIKYLEAMATYEMASTETDRAEALKHMINLQCSAFDISQEKQNYSQFWLHGALLELAGIKPILNEEQIPGSLRLQAKPHQIKKALTDLVRLGLLTRHGKDMAYVPTGKGFDFDHRPLLRLSFHRAMLAAAEESLAFCPMEERSMEALRLRVTEDQKKELDRKINALVEDFLAQEAPKEKTDAVYQLNIQMFPLWKKEDEDV